MRTHCQLKSCKMLHKCSTDCMSADRPQIFKALRISVRECCCPHSASANSTRLPMISGTVASNFKTPSMHGNASMALLLYIYGKTVNRTFLSSAVTFQRHRIQRNIGGGLNIAPHLFYPPFPSLEVGPLIQLGSLPVGSGAKSDLVHFSLKI